MSDVAEMITAFQELSELESSEVVAKFWGRSPGSRDYDIYDISLAAAATDHELPITGYFVYAWTDGTLDGISIKPNSKEFKSIPLEQQGYESAVGFDRLWLTWTAQAGKTLHLFIGRRKGTHLTQIAVGGGGGGSGGIENRSAWAHGHKTVTAAGTAEQMTAVVIPNGFHVTIHPLNSNTGLIFLGQSKADCEDAGKRVEMDFGEPKSYQITNLNLIWIDAEVTGEGVWYAVET